MVRPVCLAGATAVLAVTWGPAPWNSLPSLVHGTLAGHMLQHLLVMNLAALLLALAVRPRFGKVLAVSTVLQIALLWAWHVPAIYASAQRDLAVMVVMQASLLAAAFLFWGAVLAHPVAASWRTIFATLMTAKAFCLFGALLCFSRRILYLDPGHGDHRVDDASALDDQQLAGLLMMASCALVYVAAAMILFLRWLDEIGRAGAGERPSWRRVDA